MSTEDINASQLENLIDNHAKAAGFRLIDNSHGDLRIYRRDNPEATARVNYKEAEHAMMRSISEFDRLLTKRFDK